MSTAGKNYRSVLDANGDYNTNQMVTVTARDELQVHYDTLIEEYSNNLVFLTNTRYKHTIN